MAKITKIEPQQKDKSRVSIFLDDEFYCGLDVLTMKKHRLAEGGEVNEAELDAIRIDAAKERFFEKALKLINIRPRSRQEIRQYLAGKGAADDELDAVVEKLEYYNYINDVEFAEYYVNSYKKRWGMTKIRFELRRYGVEQSIIDEVISQSGSQADEAYNIAKKYFKSKPAIEYNKAFAFLYSKGFSPEDIKSAFIQIKEEMEQGDNFDEFD